MDANASDPAAPPASPDAVAPPLNGILPDLEHAYRQAQRERLRYQELFDFAPDGYVVTDLFGIIREVNHAAAALLNTRKEFLPGKPLPFYVAAEDRPAFYQRLVELRRQTDTARDWEVCLRPPHGGAVDVALRVAIVSDQDGLPAALRWLVRDIGPGKRIEQALSAANNFSDVLIDTAQVVILVVDAAGCIVRSNPFLSAVCGYSAQELAGQDWCRLLVAEADRPAARELLLQVIQLGAEEGHLYELTPRDGPPRAVVWSGKHVTRGLGAPAVLLTGRDVTDLRDAQRQALQAERLAAIGQTVAGLAHEGRNALQRSHACLERLGWKLQDRPEELDLVARAQKAHDDLVRLFEDVQGYAAPIRLDRAVCDLAVIWEEAWAELASQREGRDARLCAAAGGTDLYCYADGFRLRQVFRNVLENALAACADPVSVHLSCQDAELDGSSAIRVAVRDNGSGLSAAARHSIFEPFYTTKVKGTGLGMAIVKRIVEAHGGRVAADDSPEGGAEIVIILPRSQP